MIRIQSCTAEPLFSVLNIPIDFDIYENMVKSIGKIKSKAGKVNNFYKLKLIKLIKLIKLF